MRLAAQKVLFTCCLVPWFGVSLNAQTEDRRVKHILVASKEEAVDVRKQIVAAGGDRKAFTKVARTRSKDATTRILGGDLGWVNSGTSFDPVFLKAATDLDVGKVSEPVQSSFGWHLIYVVGTRSPDSKAAPGAKSQSVKKPAPKAAKPKKAGDGHDHADHAGHDHAGHDHADHAGHDHADHAGHDHADHAGHDHADHGGDSGQSDAAKSTEAAAALIPKPSATPSVTPAEATSTEPKVAPRRRTLLQKSFRISIETVNSVRQLPQHYSYKPTDAIEFNVMVKNESAVEQKFFVPQLLSLGIELTDQDSGQSVPGAFASLEEPADPLITLQTYEIRGFEFSLNDFFPEAESGRYTLTWNAPAFFANLEQRFPKFQDLEGYSALRASLSGARAPFLTDVVLRDRSQHARLAQRDGMDLAIFENIRPQGTYFARLTLRGEQSPVLIKLFTQKQYRAAKHFVDLVMEGFYDRLNFFEIKENEYLLGGDPLKNGTGAPPRLLMIRNAGVPHKRGTVSFVSRGVRGQGPVQGGQAGSIFFVGLRDHPEWDDQHVPFGEVVSGMDVLERQVGKRQAQFDRITIVAESDLGGAEARVAADETESTTLGNPEVMIKTSRGEFRVELYEDTSRNTVANFITLAEDKFFDGQKFFYLMKDQEGKRVAILAGSPDNTAEGGPGYTIPDEPNPTRKHVRGALVMVKQYDAQTGSYMADTAGSQFFICLSPIPYYDSQKFTIFGQVRGSMAALDALEENDTIESVTVVKKKDREYKVKKS